MPVPEIPDEVYASDTGAIYSIYGKVIEEGGFNATVVKHLELVEAAGFVIVGVTCHPGHPVSYLAFDKFMATRLAAGVSELAGEL